MGMISSALRILGRGGASEIGGAIGDVARVFRPDATRQLELGHDAFAATQAAYAAEYQHAGRTWWDSLINGINRLPRPAMALGTLGLFAYAMGDPDGFTLRMAALATVPEPLWWLLGAVVAFYFGAREAHHLRAGATARRGAEAAAIGAAVTALAPRPAADDDDAPGENAAIQAWVNGQEDLDP